MSAPLTWSHRLAEIPEAGMSANRSAAPPECAAVAQALDLVSCESLDADYVIRPTGDGRYRMSGTLSAELVHNCVVTLEPVTQTLKEHFDVALWPGDSLPEVGDTETEVLGLPDIEMIRSGTVEAGRILFEILSAALDPYPRKPGARFQWEDREGAAATGKTGPFDSLKRLKDEP